LTHASVGLDGPQAADETHRAISKSLRRAANRNTRETLGW
jgi:hypothetical protein